jgi:circadian clock protein KaiC
MIEMADEYTYKTGVCGLDEVMLGGFIDGHSVMIEGYTGTGKTIFGETILVGGINEMGENGVIVSFEQLPESLYRDALSLGWDFRAMERENKLRVVFISPATLIEELTAQISRVGELIAQIDARRLYIDGINMLEMVERDPFLKRQLIDRVIAAFRREGLNVYFSRERPESTPLGTSAESYIADTVIQLSHIQQHNRRIRYAEVVKSRGQNSLSGLHTFKIERGGITIYPRQKTPVLQPLPVVYGQNRLNFGVPGLDDILRGGVFQRSSTLIAGSSGTGKTLLCLQFLLNGARRGERGLFVSLEEPADQIIANARSLGADIDRLLGDKMINILSMSPLETDINEQIIAVREAISRDEVKRFAFDSLSNYEDLLPEEDYKDYVYAFLAFVKSSGVTSLFTSEIRALTAVERVTSYGTSYLLDNIIMLRFVELENSLRRIIAVLKTRGSSHGNEIREYVISDQGIELVPLDPRVSVPVLSLQQYSHVLTAFPVPRQGRGSRASRENPEKKADL